MAIIKAQDTTFAKKDDLNTLRKNPNTLRKNPAPGDYLPIQQGEGHPPERHPPARSNISVFTRKKPFFFSLSFAKAAFEDVWYQRDTPTESKISWLFVQKSYIFLNGFI
jgi:hypothetical protein